MENAITLYAYLVLTFLGFIAPILTILLSLFQEGLEKLAEQYDNEIFQQEENINKQLKKLSKRGRKSEKTIKHIEKNLKKLKILQKQAKYKLDYLRPQKQICRIFILLIFSFSCILIVQLIPPQYMLFIGLLIVMSIAPFVITIWIVKNLMKIIVEVQKSVTEERRSREDYIISLLQESSHREDQFLNDVFLSINNVKITDDQQIINIVGEEEQDVDINIINLESRMAKQIEVGFIFPYDFLIGKSRSYTIYKGENEQILRYEIAYIHGHTTQIQVSIKLTALSKGEFDIKTFIKAENIKSMYKNVKFTIK